MSEPAAASSAGAAEASGDVLAGFHPAVAEWFRRRFPGGPTPAQALGWRSIAAGEDTLIAAPTGSGKTLAGFLVAIDRCFRAVLEQGRAGTAVLYVSPLRALTVDVRENLEAPLQEISAIAAELGMEVPPLRVAVRNGDTPQSARAAMVRDRPEIVVTTPESLYLLLTAPRGRAMLAGVETVIVDEIHALARDKRGSHLALSLERLDRCVLAGAGTTGAGGAPPEASGEGPVDRRRPTRIGLSATQRPIDAIARLLVGAGEGRSEPDGRPRCAVVDVGHRRRLDVAIELPGSELEAVMATEQLMEVVGRIAELIAAHRTTLVFTNTRRMAERIAHLLGEILGEETVCAHHGSLSTARRLGVERRLRAGELRAVVATASLELGIDVGPVDLVCQLASPRSIATFLQRVGRAEHRLDGVPKGRLFPLTRDELVECVALLGAVADGDLDATSIPVAPLDILAQQVVAECAAAGPEGIGEDELLALVRRAAPYAELPGEDFEAVVELMSNGVTTGRGPRGAHLHRDQVNGVLRPRRGARLTAATSGGAIPELADYKVLLEPDETVVGTVHEDWAVEAMAGDVFLLGSSSWRIRRVEQGVVRVVDAEGATPTLPFWLGEAPGRTAELADAVCRLRSIVEEALRPAGSGGGCPGGGWAGGGRPGSAAGASARGSGEGGRDDVAAPEGPCLGPAELAAARSAVIAWSGASERAAEEVVAYLAAALAQLGVLPTKKRLVLERFFDDTGGMQLVVHAPFGARVNRGLGLALRKKFCRSFDFELQAAANDDAVVLSLGPQHSFPLDEVTRYLSPHTVRETLEQAVLPTPIFASRWRWNLGRSLVSPRYRGSRHLPPAIQRMEADDLMAAIFPALAACQENVTGPIVLPDHPIVRQTMGDCLSEAIDLAGVTALVAGLRDGEVAARCVDVPEPSLLAHEILSGRPYTDLDDAPLEERRTRAVQLRRGIPLEAHDLTTLDPAAATE
ncbi:MAG TPA: DEAD/DEAH box helicase, partial [Acidimicrobiales bacterium]|nr:DEAD/DEAH box helicase [Acidimicrobiales bacterium]